MDHEKNIIILNYLLTGIGLLRECVDLARSAGLL